MEIHWHHAELFSSADRAAAEARLRSLAAGATDVNEVRITAQMSLHHRRAEHEVAIIGSGTHGDVAVSRLARDAGLALGEAVDAFERRVRRRRERDRDDHRAPIGREPTQGVIDRVFADDGYGFIVTDGGEVVYFHRSALGRGLRLEALGAGQRVRFELESGVEGSHARRVAPAPTAVSSS